MFQATIFGAKFLQNSKFKKIKKFPSYFHFFLKDSNFEEKKTKGLKI
jgi:hypothetical protein